MGKKLGFYFATHKTPSPTTTPSPETLPRHRLSSQMMLENITAAEIIITKWSLDSTAPSKPPSLFPVNGGRLDSSGFLRAVSELQLAMLHFSSPTTCLDPPASRSLLIRSHSLMQSAMRRLELEFHRVLSSFSDHSEPGPAIISDLRSIADAMLSNGYSRECLRIYKLLRKSAIGESLHRLGFDGALSLSQTQKLGWESLDLRISSWLSAARPFASLIAGERMLCDGIFRGAADSVRESCFADVARGAVLQFLAVPLSASKTKLSPEKLFRILDLFEALSGFYSDIKSLFSLPSGASVVSKTASSVDSLAKSARTMVAEFEAALHRETSKTSVRGSAIHPITRYAMNYLAFLADYTPTLADIYSEFPFCPPKRLPDVLAPSPSSNSPSPVAERFAWLLLILLCKIDLKAEFYKDVALSYLFLANNLQYVVNKVRGSGLIEILGEEWVARHEVKARRYADNYVRLGWGKAAAAVEEAAEFNAAFEEACRAAEGSVVADARMREEVRKAVEAMILPAYRGFCEKCRVVQRDPSSPPPPAVAVRHAPEEVTDRLAMLFGGSDGLDSGSGQGSCVGSKLHGY